MAKRPREKVQKGHAYEVRVKARSMEIDIATDPFGCVIHWATFKHKQQRQRQWVWKRTAMKRERMRFSLKLTDT